MCSQFVQLIRKNMVKIPWVIPEEFFIKHPESNDSIIFPHQNASIITKDGISEMSFSLIPSWSKERKPKFATYNARIETVLEKPTWKDPFLNQHCLVPITTFIEPVYEGELAGNMVGFSRDNELMFASGIYNEWIDKTTGEVVPSFTILTTKPYPFIDKMGHDRSPLFIKEKAFQEWLSMSKEMEPVAIREFLLENQEDYDQFDCKVIRKLKSKSS